MNLLSKIPSRKKTISEVDWSILNQEADLANGILKAKKFAFLRDYLFQVKEESERIILENRIREVHEETSGQIKKTFITPKKVQVDELIGRYLAIRDVIDLLENKVKERDNALQLINKSLLDVV